MKKTGILESLLFVSGDEGLSLLKIIEVLDVSEEEATILIQSLSEEYKKGSHGISLELLGGKYKFVTKKECKEYLERLVETEENEFLSQSALETLAIIAYNEPITRVSVDEIRGVNSSYVIRRLLIKDLIKEVGKADTPGRPNLYSVTSKFLDYFGLSSKEELPQIVINDVEKSDTDLFESKYKEQA